MTLTENAADKFKELAARGACGRGRGSPHRDPGWRLLRLPVRASDSIEARRTATMRSRRTAFGSSIDPHSAPYLAGRRVDFVDALHGRRVRDQQPERRRRRAAAARPSRRRTRSKASPITRVRQRAAAAPAAATERDPAPRFRAFGSVSPERPFRVAVVGSGPAGLLCRRAAPRRRGADRGRHDRAAPDALGTRPSRGRTRSPEHQGRLARLREDRRTTGVPLSRERRDRARPRARGSGAAVRRRRLLRSARRPIGGWAFRARTCRARGRRPSSSPGTTATRTSRISPSTSPASRAVVVGNGNVAVDVARMLALAEEELAADRHDGRGDRGDPRARRSRRSSCSAGAAPRRRPSRHRS